MQKIITNLRDFIVNELLYASDIDEVGEQQQLLTTGLLDSLGSAQLMVHLEKQFSIQLEPGDLTLENFNTLTALAALVERHLSK